MCEAPIQMSSNKHKYYTYFSKIKCREVITGDGGWLSWEALVVRLKNYFEDDKIINEAC